MIRRRLEMAADHAECQSADFGGVGLLLLCLGLVGRTRSRAVPFAEARLLLVRDIGLLQVRIVRIRSSPLASSTRRVSTSAARILPACVECRRKLRRIGRLVADAAHSSGTSAGLGVDGRRTSNSHRPCRRWRLGETDLVDLHVAHRAGLGLHVEPQAFLLLDLEPGLPLVQAVQVTVGAGCRLRGLVHGDVVLVGGRLGGSRRRAERPALCWRRVRVRASSRSPQCRPARRQGWKDSGFGGHCAWRFLG